MIPIDTPILTTTTTDETSGRTVSLAETEPSCQKTAEITPPYFQTSESTSQGQEIDFEARPLAASDKKPSLEPPKIGIFSLYYAIDKLRVEEESRSLQLQKEEISVLDEEQKIAAKERAEARKKLHNAEKSATRWGVMAKVASFFGSIMGIIVGIGMVLTGGGAVFGALLIAGGLLSLGNNLMQMFGGWDALSKSLPGDPEKNSARIMWVQIGITLISLILGLAGGILGKAILGETSMMVTRIMTAVCAIGSGIATIGGAIPQSKTQYIRAEITRLDAKAIRREHDRTTNHEHAEALIESIQGLFKSIIEVFKISQTLGRVAARQGI